MLVIFPIRDTCFFRCFIFSWFIFVGFGSRMFTKSSSISIPRMEIVNEIFRMNGFIMIYREKWERFINNYWF